jgi:hypothetical protein
MMFVARLLNRFGLSVTGITESDGAVGTAKTVEVQPGRYLIVVDEPVRLFDGQRSTLGLQDVLASPSFPLPVRLMTGYLTVAAASAQTANVSLIPLEC